MGMVFGLVVFAALLATAAAFGFFYAWSVSVMWGLDVVSPAAAIEAMNGVNTTVQNAAFALSFFGTPVLLLLAILLGFGAGERTAALWLGAALIVCIVGVHIVTFTFHIPLNQGLLAVDPSALGAEAGRVWTEYSQPWQMGNWVRTGASGLSVLLIGIAIWSRNGAPA